MLSLMVFDLAVVFVAISVCCEGNASGLPAL
ncbi:hypothetical protein predicted by Glimmer/Critica [Acetobacter senegalensis]|uniref:Uncharacterized protein n=1 Tax=Acetobacter senegalensis TaxID=446692 RepID=A0A0U5EZL4_9PROT|nr:hypothetical protein predicted by Glimmer/Critica [Acetobacter senegalensis]